MTRVATPSIHTIRCPYPNPHRQEAGTSSQDRRPDPDDQPLETVCDIRDQIHDRVKALVASLLTKHTNSPMTYETTSPRKTPAVLVVCSKNCGKSQLAAGTVTVCSTGTKPGKSLSSQPVDSMAELGIDVTGEHPKPVTAEVMDAVDAVVIVGTEAKLAPALRCGKRVSPPNAALRALSSCAWSGTPGARSCMRS